MRTHRMKSGFIEETALLVMIACSISSSAPQEGQGPMGADEAETLQLQCDRAIIQHLFYTQKRITRQHPRCLMKLFLQSVGILIQHNLFSNPSQTSFHS